MSVCVLCVVQYIWTPGLEEKRIDRDRETHTERERECVEELPINLHRP